MDFSWFDGKIAALVKTTRKMQKRIINKYTIDKSIEALGR